MDWQERGSSSEDSSSEDSSEAAARIAAARIAAARQQQCDVISVHAARRGGAKQCSSGRVAAVVWQQRQAVAWHMSVAAAAHRVVLSCVRAVRVEGGERCVFSGSRAHLASRVVGRRGRER